MEMDNILYDIYTLNGYIVIHHFKLFMCIQTSVALFSKDWINLSIWPDQVICYIIYLVRRLILTRYTPTMMGKNSLHMTRMLEYQTFLIPFFLKISEGHFYVLFYIPEKKTNNNIEIEKKNNKKNVEQNIISLYT